jgi:valyl-tRNA synthetase
MVTTYIVKRVGLIQMPTQKLTPEILTAAIEGFEQQKLRIDAQIAELRTMLPGGRSEPAATPEGPKGKRRKMSAAARKHMGDAQRKRWAESKRPSEPQSQPAAASAAPKRKLSDAGRRAIGEATKKRWAAFHAAKQAEKPSVAKKRAAKKTAAKKAAVKAPVKVAAKKTAVKKPQKKVAKAPEVAAPVAAQ